MSQDSGNPDGLEGKKTRKRKRQRVSDDSRKPKKRKSGIDSSSPFDSNVMQNALAETAVYYANGLRHVRPYMFHMKTHAKLRWVGKSIFDVLNSEFVVESKENYLKAIDAGIIRINNQACRPDTLVNHNDLLSTFLHRHEPPVTAKPLKIVHMDDEILVIDKPSSIPIHPSGRYRHNTVIHMLCREHGIFNIHPVHRLDRLTSGIMLMARNPKLAHRLATQIQNHDLLKVYLARVEGEFPVGCITVDQPVEVNTRKVGLCQISPTGKPSKTEFLRLSYNGHSSVVKCWPKTGRMHQIRVHLQWLGYPIVNDPIYNHPAWKDPSLLHTLDSPLAGVLRGLLLGESANEDDKAFISIAVEKLDTSMATKKSEAPATQSGINDQKVCSSSDSSKEAKGSASSVSAAGQLSDSLSSGVEKADISLPTVVSQAQAVEEDNATAANTEKIYVGQDNTVIDSGSSIVEMPEQVNSPQSLTNKDSPTAMPVVDRTSLTSNSASSAQLAGVSNEIGVQSGRTNVPGVKPELSADSLTAMPGAERNSLSSSPTSSAQAVEVRREPDVESNGQTVPGGEAQPSDQPKHVLQADWLVKENSPTLSVAHTATVGSTKGTANGSNEEPSRKSQTNKKGKQRFVNVQRPTIVQPLADPVDIEKYCSWCAGYSLPDPTPKELVMYLHALSYKSDSWEYTTSPPDWAADDWYE